MVRSIVEWGHDTMQIPRCQGGLTAFERLGEPGGNGVQGVFAQGGRQGPVLRRMARFCLLEEVVEVWERLQSNAVVAAVFEDLGCRLGMARGHLPVQIALE